MATTRGTRGRKPIEAGDRKKIVPMYIPQKQLDALGWDNVKQIGEQAVLTAYKIWAEQ